MVNGQRPSAMTTKGSAGATSVHPAGRANSTPSSSPAHAGTGHLDRVSLTALSNATCERLVGTLRRELLDRMLILGEAHLRAVLTEYRDHYNSARPHQGIGQRVPNAEHHPPCITVGDFHAHQIRRKPVLSGLINEYMRAACASRNAAHDPESYFRA